MLVGNDISNFQGQIDWPTYIRNSNFVICKASEGTGYIDTWFGYNRSQARLFNFPRGWYHFARPDTGNTPEQEATFFCNLMNGDPLEEGEIVALDFEVTYHDPVGWCKEWLDLVSQKLGVKPLIYMDQSRMNLDWSPVVNAGYGLWLASYNPDGEGNTGQWPFMAFQQTSSVEQVPGIVGNVDRDVFFGDADSFKAYGYKAQVITTPTTIPITVTTTGQPVASVSTPTISSATNTTTTINPTTTVQPATGQNLVKPPFSLSYLIVKILSSIKNALLFIIS